MSKFKSLKEPGNNTYSSYPYRVPVNIKALQQHGLRMNVYLIENWIRISGKIGLPLLLGVGRELEN